MKESIVNVQPAHTVETQVVGELDRRRAEEAEAAKRLAETAERERRRSARATKTTDAPKEG